MHELSIVTYVIEQVDKIAKENSLTDIQSVTLEFGEVSGIVPEYLAGLVYGGVCESTASELAARRMAMDAATSNAEEMIEKLNLYYNRARQASITQEITEIVGGAEGI